MKVTKLNGTNLVHVSINKYKFNPNKKVSKGQKILQDFLLKYISPQFLVQEFRIPGSLKRIDLLATHKKIIFEYSPLSHHNNFNPFFHKNRANYGRSIAAEMTKQNWAERNGFQWIEITEEDLLNLSYNFFVERYGVYL